MATKPKAKTPKISNNGAKSNTRKVGKVQGYLYNVSKSVAYVAMEKIKDMNPTIDSFNDSNNEIFKAIYKSAIDYRTTYKRGVQSIKKSKLYEAADIGMRSLKEDIMTGNLYNKERLDKVSFEAIAGKGGMDDFDIDISDLDSGLDDWGDFNDDNWSDFDVIDEDLKSTDTTTDGLNMSPGDISIVNAIEGTSQAQANSISMAVARSAEFQAETSIRNTNLLYTQNIQAFGHMNSNLAALNENIGGIMKYLDSNVTSHLSNSTEFFNQTTQAMQDQTALLREIVDILKTNVATNKEDDVNDRNKNKITYDSMTSGGIPDIKQYFKKVGMNTKNYINEMSGGGYDFLFNSLGEGNIFATIAANPYGTLLRAGLDKLVPKEIEKSLQDLNKSMAGFFGSLVTKFNTMAEDEDASLVEQAIGKIFGVRTSKKSFIDSSKYDKGKIDWDGESKKALVEIIPNQLSEILSVLTGDEQKFYDYEHGKFVKYSDLEKQYENLSKSFYKRATSDVSSALYSLANNNISFNDSRDKETFYKDIDNLLETLYNRNELLDVNNKELMDKFYEYSVSSQKNMAAIQALFQNLPRNLIMQMNDNMNQQYSNQTRAYEEAEKSGKYAVLFNNNEYNKYANYVNGEKNKDKVKTSFNENILLKQDNLGNNVYYYLQNMYKELNYIRVLNENNAITSTSNNIVPSLYTTNIPIESKYGKAVYSPNQTTFKGATENLIKNSKSNKRSEETKKAERYQRDTERILRDNERRKEKGESFVNLSEIDDEVAARGYISANIQMNKSLDEAMQQKRAPKSLLEKVMETKKLSEEQANSLEKINGYLKQPVKFLRDVIDKADQNLFYLIYGKEGIHEEKNINGFMDAMVFEMRKTFKGFSDFMNDQILNPLKENLGLDKDKSFFKGILEKLGFDEKTGNVKDRLKDFFQPVKDSLKNAFTGAKESVKSVLTEVTEPIRNVAKSIDDKLEESNVFNKFKNKKESEADLGESDSEGSTKPTSKPKPVSAVRKMTEAYEDNVYNNATNPLDRLNIRKSQIANINKDMYDKERIDNRNKSIEKQIQEEINELDKKTDGLKYIKAYNAYNTDLVEIKKENKKLRKELSNIGKDKTLSPKDRIAKMQEIKDKIKENDKKIESIVEEYQLSTSIVGSNLHNIAREYNDNVAEIRANNYNEVDNAIKTRSTNLNIGYLNDIVNYTKSKEFINLPLDRKRAMIDSIFGLDEEKSINSRINATEKEKAELQKTHGNLILDDKGNKIFDEEGNVKTVDNSKRIKELEDELASLKNQQATGFKYNPRAILKDIQKNYNDKNVLSLSPYFYQMIGDKNISNLVEDINEMEEILPDIQYMPGFETHKKQIKGKKQDLWGKVNNTIDKLLMNKDSYRLLGLSKRYDIDYRKKFQDTLLQSGFNEYERLILSNLFEKSVSKLDTNNEDVINTLDIEDMLSNVDSLRTEKINKKNSALRNKEKYMDKNGITSEEFDKMTDLPLNKNLKYATKDLENFEEAISKIRAVFEKRFNVVNGKMDRMNNNGNIIDMLNELSKSDDGITNDLVEGYKQGQSEFISNPKFVANFMQQEMKNSTSIVDIAKDILNELKTLTSRGTQSYRGGGNPIPSIANPLRNIEASNEQQVMNEMIDGLTSTVGNSIKDYFGRRGIRGYAKGGRVEKDDLAIVGKGEYIINPRDRKQKVNDAIANMIRNMNNEKWKDKNINDKARYLYSRIASLYGNEDIDPNEIMGMITAPGEAGSAFYSLNTTEEQEEVNEMLNIMKLAFGQRRAGNIDNYGYDTATNGETSTLFNDTMQVYKKTLNKTMAAFLGEDPEKERTKTFNVMGDILKDAKQYSPELISGGLIGGGVSLLTGMLGGPLLGAGVGAAVALTKRSKSLQDMLFGKQETDKDGNPIGYAGGIVPKDIVNKAAKVFPDLKKYGITGAVAGLLPLVPFGPIPGLILGSGVAFAKNSTTVQEHLFGPSGLFDKKKVDEFKKKLPNMLTGAGLAVGGKAILGLMGVGTPFGLVGTTLLGSALGFASTTEKFQNIVFGEYDPETGIYNGGIVPYIRTKVFDPLVEKGKSTIDTFFNWVKRDIVDPIASAIKPITQLLTVSIKGLADKIGGFFKNLFMTKFAIPILEQVKNALGIVTQPFKKIGKKIIGGIGRIISAPARMIGAAGRASQRKLIKMGKASDMTAQEKIDYMNNYRQTDYFFDRAMEQKNDYKTRLTSQMSQRFGEKEAIKINGLLSIGAYDKARKLVEKNFGDIRNPESIQIRDSLLENISKFEALGGVGFKTYGQKKEYGQKLRDQYQQEFENYNKNKSEDEKISFNDFVLMRDGDKATPYYGKYKGEDIYEQLKGVSNDTLKNISLQYESIQDNEKDFGATQYKAKKGIVNLLKNMDKGDRKTILKQMKMGNYQQAIDFLNLSMEAKGVKASDYDNYSNAIQAIKNYQMRENMRANADQTKASMLESFKKVFGEDVDMDFVTRYMGDINDELSARKRKGIVITDDEQKQNDLINTDITEINTSVTDISKTMASTYNTLEKIEALMLADYNSDESVAFRESEKKRLSDKVYRNEQKLTNRDYKREELAKKLGYSSLASAPDTIKLMPLKDLKEMANNMNNNLSETEQQNLENSRNYGYNTTAGFLTNKSGTQEEQDKINNRMKQIDAWNKSVKESRESGGRMTVKPPENKEVSKLDDYGNEVVMKTDAKTGEQEADLTDSSTRKSINMATALRNKQMEFYDSFNKLFKKGDEEEKDDKKKGGWLSKLLAVLGIGKSLLGKAKGLLGGVLGRGVLGSLFTRGIFGSLGKGALVIGGLMYLPEIINLFKNHIGPAISESWDSTIKPFITDEILPRLTEGLKTLVQEIPSLLAGTIKFIGNELIPSILKGLGWGDQNGDQEFDATDSAMIANNTAVRYMTKQGAKYASNTMTDIAKQSAEQAAKRGTESAVSNVAKAGAKGAIKGGRKAAAKAAIKNAAQNAAKEGAEEVVEQGVKTGIKDMLKSGAKSALKGTGNFLRHPLKTSVKGAAKGVKAIADAGGKSIGKVFLKADSTLMSKGIITGGKDVAEAATKVADDGMLVKLLTFVKNQFTKIFTNERVVSLLGKVKNTKLAQVLLEKFVPQVLKEIEKKAVKLSGNVLARAVGGIGTGGLVTIGFAVYDFISGFNNARNILGITTEDVPFGYKVCAAVVKTIQGLSIIATLIPTKTIMSILINVLDAVGIDMSSIKSQQEQAQKELEAYNEENGTNYSLEEYNKEVKGYKGIFGKILDAGKNVVGGIGKGVSWVGEKIGGGLQQAGNFFTEKKDQLTDWWNNNISPILDWFKNAFNSMKDWGSKYIVEPIKGIGNLFKSGYDWISEKLNWLPNKWNETKSWASDKWNSLKNGAKSLFGFDKDENKTTTTNNTVSSIKTVNGMSVGKGENCYHGKYFEDTVYGKGNIASSISSGIQKVSSFFGRGESDMDTANGNPYFSQKQATGKLSKLIGDAGCGPTSTAMALSKVTGRNISPEDIASDALKNGSWNSEGAKGSMFGTEASRYGVKTLSAGGDFDKFDKMVSAGIPTVVSGTYGKGSEQDSPYTKVGHIVTVFGKDKNGNYLVNDPRGKDHSKSYTKEELMNGFRNSWSFGKGEGNTNTSDSVPSTSEVISSARSLAKPVSNVVGNLLNKNTSNVSNYLNKSISSTGLIDSAGRVLQEVFTKIFTNDTIVNLLGNAVNSQYSSASMLLANFVPQIIKKLKQNCEKTSNVDLTKYLRAIISNANISNISFLITNFINAFNNPSKVLGNFDTYTTGMKTCAGIMATINERFIVDKVLSSDDWFKLIQDYVMPIFGESKQDLDTLKTQADKLVKEYTINASSTQAQKNSLEQISKSSTSNKQNNSIFGKITSTIGNITSTVGNKLKSAVKSVGTVASNIGSAIGSAFNTALSWVGGLFGKGDYVGKGKKIDPASVSQTDSSILGTNNFPYYSQYSERTRKPKLEDAGCGPTAAAMALTKVTGKTITPNDIADDSYDAGLYDEGGSTSNLFPYIGNKYGVDVKAIKDFDTVKKYAQKGVPMVIAGKGGKLYGTNSDGHIVTVFGKGRNGYIVNDPSSLETSALYNENYIKNGFKQAWVFGDKGYLADINDAQDVNGNASISDKQLKAIRQQEDELYGKGDSTSLTYVNGFPYWSQVAFGGNISAAGCGPTAAAMVIGQVTGKTLNPKDMCEQGQAKGYWSPNAGVTNSEGLFGYYANKYNVSKELVSDIGTVKKYAEKGYPMIVDGRASKSSNWSQNCLLTPYGPNGHYVALFGKDGDDYVINDPRGSKYSGRRSEAQLSDGFRFAYKIGDKAYSVDSSKVKNVGDGDGVESSGSSTEASGESTESTASDFFSDMATAAVNFSKKLFGFEIEVPTSTAASTDSGGYTNVDGENTAEKIVNFMKAKGASNATVAGILGNAWCESSMNPAENNSTAFGLFQWLHQYGQWEALQQVASDMNTTWSDPVAQMNYWWKQANDDIHTKRLQKLYSNGLQGWLQESDPYKSAYNFDKWFEIGGYSDKRGRTAQTIYNKYMKDGKLVNFSQFLSTGKGDDYDLVAQNAVDSADLFDQYYGTGDSDSVNVNWGYFCDPSKGHITSYFGEKRSQYANVNGQHGALDYNIKYQPLYAPKSGKVNSVDDHSSYGTCVTVKTNEGNMYYRLAHMNSRSVNKGDTIKLGQQLGVSGNTGHSTGAHVHFEVLSGGVSKAKNGLDPLNYYDTEKVGSNEQLKLKNSDLSFTDYMDKIGANIVNETGAESSSDATTTSSDSGTTTAPDFFSDMATAVVNFSKKLFGFEISNSISSGSVASSSSDSSLATVSAEDFEKAVIMGDSIANGFTTVLPKDRVVATIGHTALQGQSNVDAVAKKNPPMVIMQYGTNDAGYVGPGNKKVSWFTGNYGTLIKNLKSKLPSAKMVVTQAFTPASEPFRTYIKKVQDVMPSIASDNGASFVDSTSVDTGVRTSDGIHFKDSTIYKKWLADLSSKLVSGSTSDEESEGQGDGLDIDSFFENTLAGNKSSDFGIRDDEFHTGVDYAAAEDTPILSPISGKVVENLKDRKYGFGNTLVVRDKNGADHRFAHMRDLSSYGLGSKIRKDDIIGHVGSTGRATGSHLHYEVSKNGTSLNPKTYNMEAKGGSNNSLSDVTLTFPESNQKIDAKINAGKGDISQANMEKLLSIIITLLTKVSNNTENIAKIIDVLTELTTNITGNKQAKNVNKNTSDTNATKSSKLLSTLQKGLNDSNFDTNSTQSILSILEQLAKE